MPALNTEQWKEVKELASVDLSRARLVHNCTIFLCSLDVLDVLDDRGRSIYIKEKDHLVG